MMLVINGTEVRNGEKPASQQRPPRHPDEDDHVNSSMLTQFKRPEPAALLPQLLPVLVVSYGSFIQGTSVIFGTFASIGLESESKEWLNNDPNETVLGFDFDPVIDNAWISK